MNKDQKKITFRERLSYWLDKRMAKGSASLFKLLFMVVLLIVIMVGFLQTVFDAGKVGFIQNAWDTLTYLLTGQFKTVYEAGSVDARYVFSAISIILGLLIMSTFIGIISNTISEKVASLSKGRSRVLEKGHTVILGYLPGETTIIEQLIMAAGGNPLCLVIADNLDRSEMEDSILSNVTIPSNVEIVCRNVDICDPESLKCCSINQCSNVVIGTMDNQKAVKAVLAVLAVLDGNEDGRVNVVSIISDERYLLPKKMRQESHVEMVSEKALMARIIAQSCTQTGIAAAFSEIFNFEGSEFYSDVIPAAVGYKFSDLMQLCKTSVPVGIIRNGKTRVNPQADTVIESGDRLIYFAKERGTFELDNYSPKNIVQNKKLINPDTDGSLLVIGYNNRLDTIAKVLPSNIVSISLLEIADMSKRKVTEDFVLRGRNIKVYPEEVTKLKHLEDYLDNVDHVVVLRNEDVSVDEADTECVVIIMMLKEIRKRKALDFSITAEIKRESNRRLVAGEDPVDFVVASGIASRVITQLVESPELYYLFQELLSENGHELHLKSLENYDIPEGEHTVREIRQILMSYGYIFLGLLSTDGQNRFCLNSEVDSTITLKSTDKLITIGRD